MESNNINRDELKKKVLAQFRTGKSLFGKDGAFGPLLQEFLEEALQAEIETHLDENERSNGNRKNGKQRKTVKTSQGSVEIETPRDRIGTFEPEIVKKRETILADTLEEKIIGLYGLGMSLRDIAGHIKEMYDTDVSATTLSSITDRIIPRIKEWQSRPLDQLYCIVWLDAMFYKVKEDGRVVTRCLYNILGVNVEGKKEILGMYVSQSEGANFWLSVLTDLKQRGVEDILICSIDGLKGFPEAILTVYPATEIQSCIVHQIRNSLKYISYKEQKAFMADLKLVYQAPNKDIAESGLDALEEKWGAKYPLVLKSWRTNWANLSTYFKYPEQIRKLIYTTNAIEGYHRQIRKVTKNKGAFTSDMALMKLVYLATQNISKKWNSSLWNWNQTLAQLSIIFGERLNLSL
ncbi:MAG: IS256 family transposase [Burkholderiales bacterium PBB4]|nr:MAG: IS256 family transposase [Burkholderiales bacterium PBB4]